METFWVVTTGVWGRVHYWHLASKDQEYCETFYNAQDRAPRRNFLVRNVDSAEVEKLCSRGLIKLKFDFSHYFTDGVASF